MTPDSADQSIRCAKVNAAGAAISAEGGGVYTLTFLATEDIVALTLSGERPVRFLRALDGLLKGIASHPGVVLCLTCDATFNRDALPVSYLLVTAHHDTPEHGLLSGICGECHAKWTTTAEMQAAALDAVRRHFIPGLRLLPPLAAAGRA